MLILLSRMVPIARCSQVVAVLQYVMIKVVVLYVKKKLLEQMQNHLMKEGVYDGIMLQVIGIEVNFTSTKGG